MTRTPIDGMPDAAGLVRALEIPVSGGEYVSAIFHGALRPDNKDIHETPDEARPSTIVIMAHHAPGGHRSAENDIFGDLEHHLAHDGFDTVRFDFRGCGTSPGNPEDTSLVSMEADIKAIHRWAEKAGYKQFVHLGDGIGALAVLLNTHERVKAYVLLWPILKPRDSYFAEGFAAMDTDSTTIELLGERVSVKLLRELYDLDLRKTLADIRQPILVQTGEDDPHIPMNQTEPLKKYAVKSRRIEITSYEGGTRGLRQLQERKTLFYHTRQFLKRYC
jgi:pimeloyl-ACP methyl ester carboxylesterase